MAGLVVRVLGNYLTQGAAARSNLPPIMGPRPLDLSCRVPPYFLVARDGAALGNSTLVGRGSAKNSEEGTSAHSRRGVPEHGTTWQLLPAATSTCQNACP